MALEDTLPDPVRTFASTQEMSPILLGLAALVLVLTVVGWVSVWRGSPRARMLYGAAWLGGLVLIPFAGPYITTGGAEVFDSIAATAGGAILGLLFLPIREETPAAPVVE